MSRILALDQATKTGFSIFEKNEWEEDFKLLRYGLYRAKGGTFEDKIINICDYFDRLIHEYQVDIILLEDVQAQTNTLTYGKLSRLVGALIELSNINEINYNIIHSSSWRSGLNIKGKTRKELKASSQKFVFKKYGLDVPDDVADSICIGTYYLMKEEQI